MEIYPLKNSNEKITINGPSRPFLRTDGVEKEWEERTK